MLKDFLNEAKGYYEKDYDTDLPEKYYCSSCLSEVKKDLKEEMKEDGYTKDEINSELIGRFYPVGQINKPEHCYDCGQYIGILSKDGKDDLMKKAETNAKIEIENEYGEKVCYCNFGYYEDATSFMEIFDEYGLTERAAKLAKEICKKYIKEHPKSKLINGEE